MYIERHMEQQILAASKHYPAVMVCGQRQVGKSTMLHHIKEQGRRYVTFDDVNARRIASSDPSLFFETYGTPLLIDEIQREASVLLEMKRIIDRRALDSEESNGLFWITGSQKFQMMKHVSDSLAGRIAVFDLSGLSAAEIDGRPAKRFSPELDSLRERMKHAQGKDIHQIYEAIFRGGMPKLVTGDIGRDRYYMDYVNTYIERDVKELSQVGKLNDFYNFIVYMAARTAQELRYEDIAKHIGVSAPTAKAWVSILEASGIIYLLWPYSSNLSKRLIKAPKVYFMDTGLAAYLLRWPDAATIENGAMDGAFLETYVVTEIIKSYYNAGKPVDLYYYRDTDGKEIDLLIQEGQTLYPIEIKKSKAPVHADKNFKALSKFNQPIGSGLVLCMCDELIPYNRDVWLCPISAV